MMDTLLEQDSKGLEERAAQNQFCQHLRSLNKQLQPRSIDHKKSACSRIISILYKEEPGGYPE